MKKRLLSLLLAFTATTMLMGCGGKEAKVDESKETNMIIGHQ